MNYITSFHSNHVLSVHNKRLVTKTLIIINYFTNKILAQTEMLFSLQPPLQIANQ